MIERVQIAIATPADMAFIVDRQKQFSNQVGFLRRKDLAALTDRGTVFIPSINNQPCGVIVCSAGRRRPLCLRSNIVEAELWENGLGTAFCGWLRTHPLARRWGGFRVLTRRDLGRQVAINTSLGGAVTSTRAPGARGHHVDEWWVPTETPAEGLPQRTCFGSGEAVAVHQRPSLGFGSERLASGELDHLPQLAK